MCLLRISANVADAIGEMFFIANQSIEVIALPEAAGSTEQLIELSCREPFPTANEFFQRPFWILDEKGVHVIRHYGERNHDDPLAFEMPQRFCHDLRTVVAS
ncbi:MAG: hypothetical protein QOF80_1138 [Verrucomicrobiota bacterium]